MAAGLAEFGVEARLLVQKQAGERPFVIGPPSRFAEKWQLMPRLLDRLPLRAYPRRTGLFSPNSAPDFLPRRLRGMRYDLLHLNWVNFGFVRIETIPRLRSPLVWTLHDMWGFTGGCHVAGTCEKWRDHCGACPVLESERTKDLSWQVFERKRKAWIGLNMTVVAPSRWMADCARQSPILGEYRVEIIPNGLDLETFRPLDRTEIRKKLKLPTDRKLILFGSFVGTQDANKGFDLLQEALERLRKGGWNEKADLVIFGQDRPSHPPELGFRLHYTGHLAAELQMAEVYAACDVVAVPSRIDNFPNTACEALACGTPVAAFDVCGLPDIVTHESDGFLAQPYDVEELANGLAWILGMDPPTFLAMTLAARQKAETQLGQRRCAERYLRLYEGILKEARS